MRIGRKAAGVVVVGLVGVVGLSRASAATTNDERCSLPTFGPGPDYRPVIDPGSFSPNVTNRLFPLVPGRTLIYTGVKDGKTALNIFAATAATKVIDGVATRVVQDRLYLDGVLEERTADYYAQDRCGNVWYFGEDTARLDEQGAVVSTAGSFRAGEHGAQPGVFMQARPMLGRSFRQEWAAGQAEDQFKAIAKNAPVTVRAGSFRGLQTEEITALEPEVVDNKFFVQGIGEVLEVAVKGGTERLELVEIIEGSRTTK